MKKHIMVIDDSYEVAKLLSTSLENTFNSNVKFHTNPFKAIEDIRTLSLHGDDKLFVICDYMMPQMDGIELYDEVSLLEKEITFILLTNENDSQIIEEASRKGIDDILLKQHGFDVILNQIAKVINEEYRLGSDLIEVFEVSDVIHGFKIIEREDGNIRLLTNEEVPRNALIKLGTGPEDNDIYRVNSCKIIDDRIQVDCTLVTTQQSPIERLRIA